jgi:hypothetical protein
MVQQAGQANVVMPSPILITIPYLDEMDCLNFVNVAAERQKPFFECHSVLHHWINEKCPHTFTRCQKSGESVQQVSAVLHRVAKDAGKGGLGQ